jgi:hypothetical protein
MYAVAGAAAGILAGLLGIGGGLVIVPMLVFCFARQGISEQAIMHLALGTSMASIMFTAVRRPASGGGHPHVDQPFLNLRQQLKRANPYMIKS